MQPSTRPLTLDAPFSDSVLPVNLSPLRFQFYAFSDTNTSRLQCARQGIHKQGINTFMCSVNDKTLSIYPCHVALLNDLEDLPLLVLTHDGTAAAVLGCIENMRACFYCSSVGMVAQDKNPIIYDIRELPTCPRCTIVRPNDSHELTEEICMICDTSAPLIKRFCDDKRHSACLRCTSNMQGCPLKCVAAGESDPVDLGEGLPAYFQEFFMDQMMSTVLLPSSLSTPDDQSTARRRRVRRR
jgi:hypothetical protein